MYNIRPKVQWVSPGANNSTYNNFDGESEPVGLEVYFHSNTDRDTAMVEILQGALVVNEFKVAVKAGMNKMVWNMQKRQRERTEREKKQAMSRLQRFRDFISEERAAAMMANIDYIMGEVQPGPYTIRMTVGGQTYSKVGTVLRDQWSQR